MREDHTQKTHRAPSLSTLRKIWTFSPRPDGTYRIAAYKGDESDVTIPSEINGVKVTELGKGESDFLSNPFFGELAPRIRSVTLEEGLTAVGRYLFLRCGALKSVALPASLKKIGYGAFFACEALEKIALPDGLEEIETDAFEGCSALKTITIPASVTKMGPEVFRGCRGLTVFCQHTEKPLGWSPDWDRLGCTSEKLHVVWLPRPD